MTVRSKLAVAAATLALSLGAMALPAAAATTTISIADPSPAPFVFYGNGDASVTFDGVTFTQSSALGNPNLFDVGPGFSGDRPVLSSQQETTGVANILITFANPLTDLAFNFGTFGGSTVNFALSNGDSFSRSTIGSGYVVPQLFAVDENTPFTSVLVTSSDGVLNIAGVPEPAAWAVMLLGLAAVGATLRTSRRKDGMTTTAA